MTRGRVQALAGAGAFAALLTACPDAGLTDGDVVGREGLVVFKAETALAFLQPLVVGSTFDVAFRARDDDDESAPLLETAALASGAGDVIAVDGATVTLVGAGAGELQVVGTDGAILDAVTLAAAVPGATALVDGALLANVPTVDARLPAAFALRTDADTQLQVAAVDRCGGDLLDLHASSLEVSVADGDEDVPSAPAAITVAGPASFTVKTQVPGAVTMVLKTPGLEDLEHAVQSVATSQIDEVQAAASSVSGTDVSMWARAFVDDVEVVGALDFTWRADPRVTLSAVQGQGVTATVSFPAEGEPPDDRPAVVTAEVFGESGSVDLLTATTVVSRGAPARELGEVEQQTASGCGGTACDPAAALLVGLVGVRRRLRGVAGLVARAPSRAAPRA